MTLSFSKNLTEEGQARQLARHYPDGRLWSSKFNVTTVLGKLVLGVSGEWLRFQQFVSEIMNKEIDINKTDALLEEWEKSVGIPNSYFSNTVSKERRRLQVLLTLTDFGGAQTEEDFERIAALFGFDDVTIRSGTQALFPMAFPILFFSGDGKGARHTVFITLPSSALIFPMTFPIQFSSDSGFILEGVFRALLPANVEIVFIFGGS